MDKAHMYLHMHMHIHADRQTRKDDFSNILFFITFVPIFLIKRILGCFSANIFVSATPVIPRSEFDYMDGG